jgi:hypothetical protein
MSPNNPGCLRDPIWQFIGVIAAIIIGVVTILIAFLAATGRLTPSSPVQSVTLTTGVQTSIPAGQGTTPTSSVTATTAISVTTNSWSYLYSQTAPTCNNASGTIWDTPMSGTSLSCSSNGVIMQQTGSSFYAEADLDRVNNETYSQSNFRVQTQITFQNAVDTLTAAGIIIQTPQAPGAPGGYIFMCNPPGNWALQQVESGSSIPTVMSGSVAIDNSNPITISITVRQGILNASINNNQVVTAFNEKPSSTSGALATGLIIEHPGSASTAVQFSNFELDY